MRNGIEYIRFAEWREVKGRQSLQDLVSTVSEIHFDRGAHVERLQRDPVIRLEIAQKARGPIHGVVGEKLIAQLAEFQEQHDRDRRFGGREICNRLYCAVLGDPEILLL